MCIVFMNLKGYNVINNLSLIMFKKKILISNEKRKLQFKQKT